MRTDVLSISIFRAARACIFLYIFAIFAAMPSRTSEVPVAPDAKKAPENATEAPDGSEDDYRGLNRKPPPGTNTALFSNRALPMPMNDPGARISFDIASGEIRETPDDGRIVLLYSSESEPASLSWSSPLTGSTGSLRAETIVYFMDRKEIFATGDVLLLENGASFSCDTFYIDIPRKRGMATGVVLSGDHAALNTIQPMKSPDLAVMKKDAVAESIPTLLPDDSAEAEEAARQRGSGMILRAKKLIKLDDTLAIIRAVRLTTGSLESPDAEL